MSDGMRKNIKCDVLYSGTIFLLVLLLLQHGRFLVQTLLCQLNFDILFSHQLVWQRTRKFYPIYELQFILARCHSLFVSFSIHISRYIHWERERASLRDIYVSGALKFVVNGFLMQILYSVYGQLWTMRKFHIRIFMSVWGIVAVAFAAALIVAILFSCWAKSSRTL